MFIDNRFSCRYIFRLAKAAKDYCVSTNIMINNNESKKGVSPDIIQNFDSDQFHKNRINLDNSKLAE